MAFDSWTCWNATPPDQDLAVNCPKVLGYNVYSEHSAMAKIYLKTPKNVCIIHDQTLICFKITLIAIVSPMALGLLALRPTSLGRITQNVWICQKDW